MAKVKLADYVIDFYSKIGVDKIFVVYGAANGDLIDAFSRNKKTEYVAGGHMNLAFRWHTFWSRLSGKLAKQLLNSLS